MYSRSASKAIFATSKGSRLKLLALAKAITQAKMTAALLLSPPTGSDHLMTPLMPRESLNRFCSANFAPRA